LAHQAIALHRALKQPAEHKERMKSETSLGNPGV